MQAEAPPAPSEAASAPAPAPAAAAGGGGGGGAAGAAGGVAWRSCGVRGVGVAQDRNSRHRRYMEDAHAVEDALGGDDTRAFFAVYDGHGGKSAALYCQAHLHKVLAEELAGLAAGGGGGEASSVTQEAVLAAITRAYHRTDEEMKETVPSAGACAVTALVRQVGPRRVLYVANAGDARAVLSRGGTAVRLTEEHKPENASEAARLVAAGAFISDDGVVKRVNGMIGVTRALGDHTMKQWVLGTPHTAATELEGGRDTTLVLACDGVWDVMSDQEALDLVRDEPDPQQAARKILIQALKLGSTDNLSVIVVHL